MESCTSPLVDVGKAYIIERKPDISPVDLERALGIIRNLINNTIKVSSAAEQMASIVGYSEPVERILRILNTPSKPIQKNRTKIYSGPHRMQARAWRVYEDQRLLAGIHKYGLDNWQKVAAFIGNGRSAAQAAQRWCRGLDPHISREPWTQEEDELLKTLVEKFGDKSWKQVSEHVANRSDVQCRYRYFHLPKETLSSPYQTSNSPSDSPIMSNSNQTDISINSNAQNLIDHETSISLEENENTIQKHKNELQIESTLSAKYTLNSHQSNCFSTNYQISGHNRHFVHPEQLPPLATTLNTPNSRYNEVAPLSNQISNITSHQMFSNTFTNPNNLMNGQISNQVNHQMTYANQISPSNLVSDQIVTSPPKFRQHVVLESIDHIIGQIHDGSHIGVQSDIFSFLDQKIAEMSNRPIVVNSNQ